MPDGDNNPMQTPGLSKERKLGFVLLVVFVILAVGLGILQIRNTLYKPFGLSNEVPASIKDQINTLDALRWRDTDQDGLNDFDERYVYGTSAYIEDTDSDGLTDSEEIALGEDPLCHKDKDCENPIDAGDNLNPSGDTEARALIARDPLLQEDPPDFLQMLNDPAAIRKLLIDAGVDEAAVRGINDKDLLDVVKDVLATTSTIESLNNINNILSAPTE